MGMSAEEWLKRNAVWLDHIRPNDARFSDVAEPAASDECTAEYACGVHHRGCRIAPLESARELNDMFATRRHRAHATVGLCAARNVWSSFDVHCAWALCIRDMHINPCYDHISDRLRAIGMDCTCLWNGDNMPITFYRLTHRWANFFYRGPHWKFYCCRRAAYIFCLLKLQFSTYENMK